MAMTMKEVEEFIREKEKDVSAIHKYWTFPNLCRE